jgi:hypothetical protein
MKRLKRVAWVFTFFSPLFLLAAVLLSSRLGNGLALTSQGYCLSVLVDPETGHTEQVSKLWGAGFVVSALASVVLPPVLWATVLGRWTLGRLARS